MSTDARAVTYRLFRISLGNRVDGAPDVIEAADHADALRQATERLGDATLELWAGPERIATLQPYKAADTKSDVRH